MSIEKLYSDIIRKNIDLNTCLCDLSNISFYEFIYKKELDGNTNPVLLSDLEERKNELEKELKTESNLYFEKQMYLHRYIDILRVFQHRVVDAFYNGNISWIYEEIKKEDDRLDKALENLKKQIEVVQKNLENIDDQYREMRETYPKNELLIQVSSMEGSILSYKMENRLTPEYVYHIQRLLEKYQKVF